MLQRGVEEGVDEGGVGVLGGYGVLVKGKWGR